MRSWITQKQCRRKKESRRSKRIRKRAKQEKRKSLPEKKREAFQLMEKGKETIILRSNATRTIRILCTDVISMMTRSNFEQSSARWVRLRCAVRSLALIQERSEMKKQSSCLQSQTLQILLWLKCL